MRKPSTADKVEGRAGEAFARAAEQRRLWPHAVTLAIALVLLSWAAYALAGAGLLPLLLFQRHTATPFIMWSSLISLSVGLIHAAGLLQVWQRL